MQGFKPKTHKAQHLAGGGIVDSIKGMLGFKPADPERAKMIAEYRANQEREKQAKQAQANKPAENAISSYSGDSALQRRMKEVDSYKDGGMIRGKGTGTSDSIPRGFKPGTFIMPADSTKAIGPKVLENVAKVPTKVSNGEFAHTPEQVHAVGINALRQMKDATHNPKDDGMYFANGGEVRGFKPEAQHFVDGDRVKSKQELYDDWQSKKAPWYLPTPKGNMEERVAEKVYTAAVRDPSVPVNSAEALSAPATETVAPNPTDSRLASGTQTTPGLSTQTQTAAPPTAEPAGVTRIDRPGQSPLFTNMEDGGQFGNNTLQARGAISAQNMGAADALAANSQAQSMARIQQGTAPVEARGFSGVIGQQGGNGNMWSRSPEQQRRDARVQSSSMRFSTSRLGNQALKALDAQELKQIDADTALQQSLLRAGETASRNQTDLQRTSLQEAGAIRREGDRNALAGEKLTMEREAQGFKTRAQAQLEGLRSTLIDPKATPEQKAQAQAQLMALSGANGDKWKALVLQGGTDAMGNKTEGVLAAVNERTGEMKRFGGQGAAVGPVSVSSPEQLAALPKGAVYVGPDGKQYRKN